MIHLGTRCRELASFLHERSVSRAGTQWRTYEVGQPYQFFYHLCGDCDHFKFISIGTRWRRVGASVKFRFLTLLALMGHSSSWAVTPALESLTQDLNHVFSEANILTFETVDADGNPYLYVLPNCSACEEDIDFQISFFSHTYSGF
jgi:hypothetical protein